MHLISRDSPCYYLTSVTVQRLPVFRTDVIKVVTCRAFDEARNSGEFALYAYVVMPNHFHVITDSARSSADTLTRSDNRLGDVQEVIVVVVVVGCALGRGFG